MVQLLPAQTYHKQGNTSPTSEGATHTLFSVLRFTRGASLGSPPRPGQAGYNYS